MDHGIIVGLDRTTEKILCDLWLAQEFLITKIISFERKYDILNLITIKNFWASTDTIKKAKTSQRKYVQLHISNKTNNLKYVKGFNSISPKKIGVAKKLTDWITSLIMRGQFSQLPFFVLFKKLHNRMISLETPKHMTSYFSHDFVFLTWQSSSHVTVKITRLRKK